MKKLKFGIAGYGKMGKIREKSIERSNKAEVVAIYDIDSITPLNRKVKSCGSYQELLESGVDAIFVSTYVKFASEYTIRALKADIHVFCEKPPAMNAKEMLDVLAVEQLTNKILKYGFNHRYHYSVIEAKKLINTGNLGRLLLIRGVYGKAGSIDFHTNWRYYKNYSGGGILIDQGIHMLDLFRYFSQSEFHNLHSYLTKLVWDTECEDNAFLILKSNDVIATLHSSATQWKHKFFLEMTFENGYINLDGILSSTGSYTPETLVVGQREVKNTLMMGKPEESIQYFEQDDSWNLELDEFLSAIDGHSKVMNGTSKDAYEVMKLVDSIYQHPIHTSVANELM